MNLSTNWLKELVPFDLSPEALAAELTRVGLCIEEMRPAGDDTMLVGEVTTNRPDWLCHWGVAHEIAAFTGKAFSPPPIELPAPGEEKIDDAASVTNEAEDLCPRYTARLIRGVKVGPSPAWLRTRLESVGLKPRNNVVDITNLVLFEMNQPLHAFDFDLLKGGRVVVRRAREKEKFTSVFGEERELSPSMCVIADAERAVALAGIKGGMETGVTESTTSILLESAYFDPASTRRASRAAQLDSDSSYRFERGIDPGGVERASARAAQLICELAGGTLAGGIIDTCPGLAEPWECSMRFARCESLLGLAVDHAQIQSIFEGLGLETVRKDAAEITVTVPTFRQDLTREADLIEEVARCHGYEKVPERISMSLDPGHVSAATAAARTAREVLVGLGYRECLTDSFVGAAWTGEFAPLGHDTPPACVRVVNPVREDRPYMRASMLPGLLEARRVNRLEEDVRLFEINRVFLPADGGTTEPRRLVLLDDRGPQYLRGALETLAAELRLEGELSVTPLTAPLAGYENGTTALFSLGSRHLAVCGAVARETAEAHDLLNLPALLEADFGALVELPRRKSAFTPLSRFPGVARDIALVVPETVRWAEIEKQVRALPEMIDSVEFASIYRGKQIGPGKKSAAFSIVYRHPERSLTDEEANELRDRMVAHLTARIKDSALR